MVNNMCFGWLKQRLMKRRKFHPKGFSTEFHDNEWDFRFSHPFDVKVSNNMDHLVVSDDHTIKIFDLKTRLFITQFIDLPSSFISVEVGCKGDLDNDSLILSCDDQCVYKYDLKELVEKSLGNNPVKYIWKNGDGNTGSEPNQYNIPQGSAVCYYSKYNTWFTKQNDSSCNMIFVCDCINNRIKILNSKDGQFIDCIGNDITLLGPIALDFTLNNDLLVSEFDGNQINILGMDGGVVVSKRILPLQIVNPCGIILDKATQNIILCTDKNKIVIINAHSQAITRECKTEGDQTQMLGLCIDEKNGQLFVTNLQDDNLYIFQ